MSILFADGDSVLQRERAFCSLGLEVEHDPLADGDGYSKLELRGGYPCEGVPHRRVCVTAKRVCDMFSGSV